MATGDKPEEQDTTIATTVSEQTASYHQEDGSFN
jgi:hypothetical protein